MAGPTSATVAVGSPRVPGPTHLDHQDGGAVHLVDGGQRRAVQPERPGEQPAVGEHVSRVVAGVQTDVEAVERRLAPAAEAAREGCGDAELLQVLRDEQRGARAGRGLAPGKARMERGTMHQGRRQCVMARPHPST